MSGHECPSCAASFDSRRGLGVHHSAAHDELLPNRECSYCGTEFHCKHEKKYCSDECRDEAVSFAGDENPNYSGAKIMTTCEICDSEFEYYPSDKDGVYCPECVETEDWRPTQDISGENNPRWNGGKLTVECETCEEPIERYPSNITGEVSFCSIDCRKSWLSNEFTGEGHPNWEGGGTGPYGPGWNEVRRKALERDDYECQVCGKTKAEIGRNPDVHHIVPVRVFAEAPDREMADAHFLDNVISLCIDCHRKADFGQLDQSRLGALAAA